MQTNNHDVLSYIRKLDRFIIEIGKSASSSVSVMGPHDKARLISYLDAIEGFQAWVEQQPTLDLPETAPQVFDIPDTPVLGTIESDDIVDIVRLLTVARTEIANSQSSRQGSGLLSFDSTRLTSYTARCRAFLVEYIETVGGLDLPESSPMNTSTGSGLGGIEPTAV